MVCFVALGCLSCTLDEGDHEQMVNLQEVKDNPAAQLANLTDALERSPRDGSLYARRAVALLQKGELNKALQDAEKAVELTNNEPASLFVKAQVLRALGKPEEALPLALRAERNSYQSASLYVLLGDLYLKQQQYEQAREYIRKAQELSPTDEFAFYFKGRVQEATGDTARAIQNYKLALQQLAEFTEAQRDLAALLLDKGESAAAKPYLQKAIAKAPNDAKLWYNQGLLYLAEQKPDSAAVALRKAVSINDELPGAHYRLGLQAHALGNNEEALEHLTKAYEAYKSNPEYLGKLASAYERLGYFTRSLGTYRRLVEVAPNYTYAYQAIARLKYKIEKPLPDSAAVRLQEQIER